MDFRPRVLGGWSCCYLPFLDSGVGTSGAVSRPSFASPAEPETFIFRNIESQGQDTIRIQIKESYSNFKIR